MHVALCCQLRFVRLRDTSVRPLLPSFHTLLSPNPPPRPVQCPPQGTVHIYKLAEQLVTKGFHEQALQVGGSRWHLPNRPLPNCPPSWDANHSFGGNLT